MVVIDRSYLCWYLCCHSRLAFVQHKTKHGPLQDSGASTHSTRTSLPLGMVMLAVLVPSLRRQSVTDFFLSCRASWICIFTSGLNSRIARSISRVISPEAVINFASPLITRSLSFFMLVTRFSAILLRPLRWILVAAAVSLCVTGALVRAGTLGTAGHELAGLDLNSPVRTTTHTVPVFGWWEKATPIFKNWRWRRLLRWGRPRCPSSMSIMATISSAVLAE
mmetsp:Transcript_10981/g.19625  ORF Transcript_10981/g.19625 Transcript_10981/m.19625 type:complete len:222 (+) Transcript_10981:1039-1704(+)